MIRTMTGGALATATASLLLAGAGAGAGAASAAAPAGAPITAEVNDSGYAMPSRLPGGLVTIRFRNTGTRLHEFAMGRAAAGRGVEQVRAAVRHMAAGAPPPPWLHDVGGPGNLTAGAQITLTRRLRPGLYVVFDGVPDRRGVPGIARGIARVVRVAGDTGASAPAADATITAGARRFDVPPIPAGAVTIRLRNGAHAPREFRLTTLNPGRTLGDLGRWVSSFESTGRLPRGPAPIAMLGAVQSIPPGATAYVTLDLQAGREYALGDDGSGALARFTPR